MQSQESFMPVEFAFKRRKVHHNVNKIDILVLVGAQVQTGRLRFVMIRMIELAAVYTSGKWNVSPEFDGFNCKQSNVK